MVHNLGPLGAYERNVRFANEELIEQGNYSEVPSTDVLKNIGREFNKRYELDEDMYKAVRMLRFLTAELDDASEVVKGKVLNRKTFIFPEFDIFRIN